MQLFLNATSPFARLARVVAIEKGCAAQLQLVWCDPWGDDPALLAVHPQGRIPVLLTDSGQALSESLLIAQYLDGVGDGPSLLPPEQHTTVLATTSVAYGLMESAFATVIARKHHGDAADSSVLGQRRLRAIDRALQWLDTPPPAPMPQHKTGQPTLDQLACAVALEYVQFRLPAYALHHTTPRLYQWLQSAGLRPSLHSTRFA